MGEELTASKDGIADADGLTGATFAWRWLSNDGVTETEIGGATQATYTPVAADVGKTLRVQVTFTDDGETEETLVSEGTAAVAATVPRAPVNLSVAAPEGREGELAVSWTAPESDGGAVVTGYRVQWKSGTEDYDGSASSTRQAETDAAMLSHTIAGLDNGIEHTVRVLAVNGAGDGAAAEAAATPRDRVAPTLSDATVDGASLTLTFGEALDESSVPAAGAFSVTVEGVARTVDGILIAGSTVTLTLASAVAHGETATVRYTVPSGSDASPLRDAAGNAAAAFSGEPVTSETPAAEASVPGMPRNLEVTVSAQYPEKLLVSWAVPSSDGGSLITGYKIQYKLSEGATFDHEVAVSSSLTGLPTGLPRSVAQVANGSGREHTVRVVATNAVGDGPPSAEDTATPLTPVGHLRAFIEKDIVGTYGAANPWVRKAWEYMSGPGFRLSVANPTIPGGLGQLTANGMVTSSCSQGSGYLMSCRTTGMVIHPDASTSARVIVHEMAHVYTNNNGLAANPAPLGVAHVYLDRLRLAAPGNAWCRSNELAADLLTISVLPDVRTTYWHSCNRDNAARQQAAMAVVRRALRGRMPAWFGTTYGSSDPGSRTVLVTRQGHAQ